MLIPVLVVSWVSAVMTNEIEKISPNIVGGRRCTVEANKFMVSIRHSYTYRHFCGGSLLSHRWVLSAAHCFINKNPWNIVLIIGVSYIQPGKSQSMYAEKFVFTKEHDPLAFHKSDIALVYMQKDVIIFTDVIDFITLPNKNLPNDLSAVCDTFTAAGWSLLDPIFMVKENNYLTYKASKYLYCVKVTYNNESECYKESFEHYVPNTICAMEHKEKKDSCHTWDSGSPLFCDRTVYGIVTVGFGCATPGAPTYYTRVDRYLDFINYTMATGEGAPLNCVLFVIKLCIVLLSILRGYSEIAM